MKTTENQDGRRKYKRVDILGLGLDKMTMQDVLKAAEESIISRKQILFGVVNVAKLVKARKDVQLRQSVEQADYILADGLPLVWLSRVLGRPLPGRIAGIDIMIELLKEAGVKNWRVYFLGANPHVLARFIENVRKDFNNVQIAGFRDGYFTEEQQQDVADNIKKSSADILFVGISSPKKENFLSRWHQYINVPVCHGVGGSFDVIAGVTKRAPLWMQKCGLEWFYRFLQEPRRMWKRYLVTNAVFVGLSIKEIVKTWAGRPAGHNTAADSVKREAD